MDSIDKAILAELQDNFPIEQDPYTIIAKRLGIDVEELWKRFNGLLDCGVIRRMGASIHSQKFGFQSTLAAISVANDRIDLAAELMEKFPEITHCYLRDHRFNIWFTVIAPDKKRIDDILETIRSEMSLPQESVLNVPVKRLFKLDARFTLE
jgi:DNA-binding Lrp family transcriptional regulator